jgi:hypothetical protein
MTGSATIRHFAVGSDGGLPPHSLFPGEQRAGSATGILPSSNNGRDGRAARSNRGDTAMQTEIQNADMLEIRVLADAELDTVTGGKVSYYEMNGHWYIVGHNKYGQSTGVTQVS